MTSWVASLQLSLVGQTAAIDGKTLRRSFDTASGKAALHLVSAWAGELRLSLGQVAVDQKSNEISAVLKLGTTRSGRSGRDARRHALPEGDRSVGMVYRHRELTGKVSEEVSYFIK